MDFILENIVWFIAGGFVLIMTIIGYYAEKTDFTKNKKNKRKKERIKKEKEINDFDTTNNSSNDLSTNEQVSIKQPINDNKNAAIENVNSDQTKKLEELDDKNNTFNTTLNGNLISNKEIKTVNVSLESEKESKIIPNQNIDDEKKDISNDNSLIAIDNISTKNDYEIIESNADYQETSSNNINETDLEKLDDNNDLNNFINSSNKNFELNCDQETVNDINNVSKVFDEEKKDIYLVDENNDKLTNLIEVANDQYTEKTNDDNNLTNMFEEILVKEDYNINDSDEIIDNEIVNIDESINNEEKQEKDVINDKILKTMDVEIPNNYDNVINIDDITSHLSINENKNIIK